MTDRPDPEMNALRSSLNDAMARELDLRRQLICALYDNADLLVRIEKLEEMLLPGGVISE